MDFTDGVAIGDPGVMREQVRVGANIEADTRRPARHRIQADVGNRVVLAQQMLARRQVLVDKGEARPQPRAENILRPLASSCSSRPTEISASLWIRRGAGVSRWAMG
jgi:hypothetical protein